MAKKIYKKNNYLYIVDTVSGNIISDSSNLFVFKLRNINDTSYDVYINGVLVVEQLDISNIQKKNGDPYTLSEFETFKEENTAGFDSASGGSDAVEFNGIETASTLNQLSGTPWLVNTSTSPGALTFNINTNLSSYVQVGSLRYYFVKFFIDNDSEITWEVTGAQNIVDVTGIGFSLGSGDVSNRMCSVVKSGVNVVSLNRDNDNDVDMFVNVTFTAIM